jgi:RND family efflux transporter MFP subunit
LQSLFTPHWLAFGVTALLCISGCQQPVVVPNAAPVAAVVAAEPSAASALEKVTVDKPARKSLQLFTNQPARLEAIERTPVHSKLPGYVKAVHFDLGDVVEQGAVLVTLDVPELEVELAQKKAFVDQSQAETRQAEAAQAAAEAEVNTAKAQARQTEAGIARAAADVVRWTSEFARLEQLAISGSINKQLVDETKQKLAAAEASQAEATAAVESAAAVVAQTGAGALKAKADVEAATARQRVAGANFQLALTMLAYAEIKAPFAGVITERLVDPGHFVLPAGTDATPLLMLERTDIVRVLVAVPELEAGLVDVGDVATIQVQSLRNATFAGQVSRTAWSLDADSRSLVAVVDLKNDDGRLRPGMYAQAKVLLAERSDVLVLPAAAVLRKDQAAHCFLVRDGKAAQAAIELGIKVGDEWEIVSGLEGDEQVCQTKTATLKDGQPVDASPPEQK